MKNILFFLAAAAVFSLFQFSPASSAEIALTFDDGPSSVTTPRILEILAKFQARATFFVTGKNAERYPEIIRAIHEQGHEIGNHTYCHFDLRQADRWALEWQISAAQDAIAEIIGFKPKIFRPPYSRINETVRKATQAKELRVVMWSVSPEDYLDLSPSEISNRVLSNIKSGSIIVRHDYRWQTVLALGPILDGLRRKGMQSVSVSDLQKH